MRRFHLLLLLLPVLLLACEELSITVPVTGITLSTTTISLTEGESETLTATVKPDYATNKKVSWKSSDSAVASVADGKVTALKAGTATITVTTEDGGKTASCQVTVNAKFIPELSVSRNSYEVSSSGETISLQITANIDYTVTSSVSWITVQNGNKLKVAENSATEDRTGTVTVANTAYGKSVTVTVRQNGKDQSGDDQSGDGLEDGDTIVLPQSLKRQ